MCFLQKWGNLRSYTTGPDRGVLQYVRLPAEEYNVLDSKARQRSWLVHKHTSLTLASHAYFYL
jgi:hypothetical protein